jgi:HK97 family phage portal protein
MSFIPRVAAALGLAKRDSVPNADGMLAGIVPPARTAAGIPVTADTAVSLSTVYRALQILATSASQISYAVERNGLALAGSAVPSLMKRPCLALDTSEFIEQTVLSLAATGNAYWLLNRGPAGGSVLDVTPLNPHEVRPAKDPKTGKLTYWHGGTEYAAEDIKHMALMKLPGRLTGLGPIQAAQVELRGALELRDYASLWFSEGKVPSGILTSEQVLTADDAKVFKAAWNGTNEKPVDNPSGVKVLGKGTTYTPIMLKPADAQWLESQQFTTTQLARLLGMPASLMLATVEGSAMTYSNVEQDWIAFTRFTLMGYLRKIENALTELTAAGQTVRFKLETLLRSDTKTRYEAHNLGITAGFLTINEARAIEGYAPLSAAELAAAKPAPAPAPTESEPAA